MIKTLIIILVIDIQSGAPQGSTEGPLSDTDYSNMEYFENNHFSNVFYFHQDSNRNFTVGYTDLYMYRPHNRREDRY